MEPKHFCRIFQKKLSIASLNRLQKLIPPDQQTNEPAWCWYARTTENVYDVEAHILLNQEDRPGTHRTVFLDYPEKLIFHDGHYVIIFIE